MGVPYSHISPEEQEQNRLKSRIEWCTCKFDPDTSYALHVPVNKPCPFCKITNEDQHHYHCGVCIKLTQVG